MPNFDWDSYQKSARVPSKGQKRCKKCKQTPCVCNLPVQAVVPAEVQARIKLEQRKGKQVTVVHDLPHNPAYFKKLLKQVKTKLSCGGAVKEGRLELQGDQRDKLRAFLEEAGFGVR